MARVCAICRSASVSATWAFAWKSGAARRSATHLARAVVIKFNERDAVDLRHHDELRVFGR